MILRGAQAASPRFRSVQLTLSAQLLAIVLDTICLGMGRLSCSLFGADVRDYQVLQRLAGVLPGSLVVYLIGKEIWVRSWTLSWWLLAPVSDLQS